MLVFMYWRRYVLDHHTFDAAMAPVLVQSVTRRLVISVSWTAVAECRDLSSSVHANGTVRSHGLYQSRNGFNIACLLELR
jgi:hypothetical protein